MSMSTAAVAQPEFVDFDPERATRKVIRPRGQSLLSRLNELYIQFLTFGVGLIYAIGLLNGLTAAAEHGFGGHLISVGYGVVPVEYGLVVGFGLLGLAAYWVAGRLGPLAITANQRHWWYSLAIDREPLLARGLRRAVSAAAVVGALATIPVAVISGSNAMVFAGRVLAGALTGAAILALAAFAQTRSGAAAGQGRPMNWLLAAASAALGAMLFGTLQGNWIFAVAPAVALVAAALGMRNKLSSVRTTSLLKAGSARGHVQAALTLMDTGELSASLSSGGKRSRVKLPGTPSTAAGALFHAEATVLARQPGRLWRWGLGLAVVPLTGLVRTFDSPVILLPVLLAAAIFSSTAAAGPLWQLRMAPSLDALLPISRTASRWVHVALPVMLMGLWTTAAAGFFVLAGGFRVELLVLGAAAGGGLGAGMLRRAFRQQEDLTKLVYLMQLGRSGPAMLGTRIRGYVLCLFALAPLALGMLFNAPEVLVTPAVVLNVVLLVIGVVTADRP
ncbi:hypothetical protein J2S90_003749 [Arthrobacter bambusae]|uniref:ABC transporter permease n=2 Tax=Arthrobacter bambusae TaxID=1338426 RepID=A0AAW8DKD8_9MICC|nr:hypothetical protein [Arthrobacter bambusae]MDQ0130941.1 hypothetical protein [Arthrobacter bambusae]MDQ0182463.1 hypothetical protein [Arthrobacter bambusae]